MHYMENKTIVLPYDFSDSSLAAVDEAISMSAPSTKLHLIHVVMPTSTMISTDPALPVPAGYDQGRHAQALAEMKSMCQQEKYARLEVECAIGDPGDEIVKFANNLHADMIVMSSHGRTGLSRLLLGSVAERVLRLAHCPVLIVRGPQQLGDRDRRTHLRCGGVRLACGIEVLSAVTDLSS